MRLLILGCFIVLAQVISFPLYAAEPVWLKDSKTGCLVFDPAPQQKETVTWTGNCVDGKASGAGEIVWYVDGIPLQTEKLTVESGVTMVAGNYTYNVSPADVDFEITDCRKSGSYRNVRAFVKEGLALWHKELVMPILDMGGEFAQVRCPKANKRGFAAVNVDIYYRKDKDEVMRSEYMRVTERLMVTAGYNSGWGFYENPTKAQRDFNDPQNKQYQALLKERNESRNQQALNSRKAAEVNAKNETRARYNAFVKKNGVGQFIDSRALEANPFIYEGKTIAVQMEFSEMLTADRAIFGGILVSGTPGNLFTAKGTRVVLAGKVLGKTPVKTPFGGEMSVPHLRFIGVHICANYACSDLVQ